MKKFLTVIFTALLVILAVNQVWAAPPSTQARYLGFSNITATGAKAAWVNGNGYGRVVVISTSNDWTAEDAILTTSGPAYTDNAGNLTGASQVGTTGSYVIDITTGTTRVSTFTNLASNTTYYIKVYEFNLNGSNRDYQNATGTNNPRSFKTLATNIGAPNITAVSVWSEGGSMEFNDGTNCTGYYLTTVDNSDGSVDYDMVDIGSPGSPYPLLGLTAGHSHTITMIGYNANDDLSSAETYTFTTATTPAFTITSYTPASGVQAIGETVVVLLTATNSQIGLSATTCSINTVDCSSYFVDNSNGTYTITYTVTSESTDITDGSDLPLSITLADGNGTASAATTDPANSGSAPGVDAHNPAATITAPAADSWSTTAISSITGTASDAGSGLSSVDIAIWIDNDKDGTFSSGDYYWNGSNFTTATTQTWNSVTVAASWTYAITINPPATGYDKYYVQTKTTDVAGNVTTVDQKFFVYTNNTVWVDDSYAGTQEGLGYIYFQTIQNGIAGVATSGTVNVAAGTYTEQVLIQKDLTLTGAGIGNTIVQAPASGRVTAPGYTAQTWTADTWVTDYLLAAYPTDPVNGAPISVKVTGFTFDANGQSHIGDRYTGVYFRKVYNDTIANAGLFNSEIKGFATTDLSATGIRVLESSKLTLSGNQVKNYTIQGIVVYGTDNLTDPIVTTTGNTLTPYGNAEGIQYRFINGTGTAGEISNNTITNGGTHGIAVSTSDHVLVKNNTSLAGTGTGITLESASYCIVQTNTIANYPWNGIAVTNPWANSNWNEIKDNTISGIHSGDTSTLGNCGWGIGLDNSSSASYFVTSTTITGNTITSNDAGIVFYGVDATNTAHNNSLSGNTPYGIGNSSTTITINATDNWWGSANGPVHTGNTFNVGSQGNVVTDNVTYVPWLNAAPSGGTSFAPVTVTDGTNTYSYSSIQAAETADAGATLDIKAGTYSENVTFSGGTNLTTITGTGTPCELHSTYTATLEKDYTISGFSASTVILGHANGQMADALTLVKTSGTIYIDNGITTSDNATVNKSVTITEQGTESGTYSGTLTITGGGIIDVTNLTLTGNPAIYVNLTDKNTGSIGISGNTFNIPDGANTAYANFGKGIVIEVANGTSAPADPIATNGFPVNITGNTFNDVVDAAIAVAFRNSGAGTYQTFSAINIYNSNTFDLAGADGYAFYKVNENSICTYLPSVDVNGTTGNTYTTTNTFGFYYNPASATLVGEAGGTETETIYTDCSAPAPFTTGTVTTTTDNVVAGYYNSNNTGINVVVPIDNTDNSLALGTVQIQIDNDGGGSWENVVTSGLSTISEAEVTAGTKTVSLADADLTANADFVEGTIIAFRAVITDFSGNSTNGNVSSTTIIRDETPPTVTMNSTSAGPVINIAEQAAGFNVNAQANENNVTLYVVNDTDNDPTYTNIATVGFANGSAATSSTAIDIAITGNNTNIVEGKTFNVWGKDLAGNVSIASVNNFTADLSAPAAPTNVVINGGVKINNANKATTTLGFSYTEAATYSYAYTTSGGAGTVTVTDATTSSSPVALTGIDLSGLEDGTVTVNVTVKDAAGNQSTAGTDTEVKDVVAPSGYSVTINQGDYINQDNYTAVGFTFAGAEVGTTYAYAFTDAGTAHTVENTGTIATATDNITGIDLTTLIDGAVTLTVTLTDAAGNIGAPATDNATKDVVDPAAPAFVINSSACINENNMSAIDIAVTGEANATVNYTISDAGSVHTITNYIVLDASGSGTINDANLSTFIDGTITVSGTQTDLAGNVSVSANDTETKNTDDAGITTLTLTSNNFLNMYAKNGQTLTLAIDADEDVTVTAATIAGNDVLSSVNNHSDADASTWDIPWTVAGVTTGNTGVFSITLQDGCGNTETFTQTALTGTNVTYDNTAPSVSSIVRYTPTSEYTNSDAPVFRVTFSEPVEITNNNVFTFSGTCTGTPAVSSATGSTGQLGSTALYTTWDVTISGVAAENGTLELELDANLTNVRDKASNNPAAYTSGESYTIDNTLPAIAVTTPTYDGSRVTSISQMQGTYSDANGVSAGNVKVSIFKDTNEDENWDNGELYWDGDGFDSATEQLLIASRTGSNLSGNWTYNIDLTGELAESQFVLTAYATDVATNVNSATRVFVVDPIPPQVVSITKEDNNTLLLTFNEDVDEDWTNVPPGLEGSALATFYSVSGTINGTPFGPINPSDATRAVGGLGTEDQVTLDFAGTPFAGIVQCDEIDIVVTSVRDVAGNTVDEGFDEATYIEPDVTAPYVTSLVRTSAAAELTNSGSVSFTVTFSEDVQGVTASSFETTGTGSALGTITAPVAANATSLDDVWTVVVTVDAAADGEALGIQVKAAGSGITDDACGHANNAFDQTGHALTAETYTVDRKAPVMAAGFLTHPITGDYWNEAAHNITWDATKLSDGHTTNDANITLTFQYSILGTFTDATNVTPTATDAGDGTPLSWTVDIPDATSVNTAKVRVTATDEAGNISTAYEGTAFVLDNTAPTVTSLTITPNNTPSNGYSANAATTSWTITADFSETMAATPVPTIAFSTTLDGILGAPTENGWDGAHDTYTWTVAVTDGNITSLVETVTVTLAQDLAGNVMTSSTKSDVKVDQVEPTIANVAILSNNAITPGTGANAGYAKVGDNVTVTFTASENIQTPIVTIATQGATESENSANPNWKGVYQMTSSESEGNVPFTVDFTDLAGNAGTQVTAVSGTGTGSQITFDKTAPTVAITAPDAGDCVNGTEQLTYTITVEANASTATQAKIGSGTLTDFTSTSLVSSLNGWGATAEGPTTITVSHTDLAGNTGTAAISVTKDTQIPTLTVTRNAVTLGSNYITTDNTVSFELNFNEAVIDFTTADITVNTAGGTVTYTAPTLDAVDGNFDYTLTFTNVAGDGPLGITVDKDLFADCAGNQIAADVTSDNFTIDNILPTITSVTFQCNNTTANLGFSEGIYSTSAATGSVGATEFQYSFNDPDGAVINSFGITHTAGGTSANMTLGFIGGDVNDGDETFGVKQGGAQWPYDRAGNAMNQAAYTYGTMKVTPADPTATASQSFCPGSDVDDLVINTGANQDKWFTTNSSAGVALAGETVLVDGTTYYGFAYNGTCYSNGSVAVTVDITDNTYITQHPANQSDCQTSVDANYTVTAGGTPPVSYIWYYSANNVDWTAVADNTPVGATYTGETGVTLNVSGTTITPGTYYYKVTVHSACGSDVTSDAATLYIETTPVNPTLATATPASASTICQGSTVEATFNTGSGGTGDEFRYSLDNGGSWAAYTAGQDLTAGTQTILVQGRRLATYCDDGTWTTLATWSVELTPVNPTLATATPASGSTVCQGSTVKATFNNGSGGNGTDSYQYSTDNGGSWASYTAGSDITAGTQTVKIQGKRNATVCNTTWSELATWNVEATPVAGTITKSPNTAAVCAGSSVSATFGAGTGGDGTDTYLYRYDGTGGWITYTSGTTLSTTGHTQVEISSTRNSTYCTPDVETVSWTVNPLPTAVMTTSTPNVCYNGTATYSVTLTGTSPWTFKYNNGSAEQTVTEITTSPYIITINNATADLSYYVTQVSDANCTNTTDGSPVAINVYDQFTTGVIETTGETICYNTSPTTAIGSATAASGGDESITYSWYSSTDNFATAGTLITGATSATYTPAGLLTATTSYRRYANDGTCNTTATVSTGTWTVTVRPQFTSGSITSGDETICYGGNPAEITASAPTGGDGTYIYKWQSSVLGDFTDAVDISSNTATYTPGALTQTTTFRRLVSDELCSGGYVVSGGVKTVTVRPQFTAGAIQTTGETICSGSDASLIGTTTPASGGDGTITYSWRSSADGYTTAIGGATGATYDPGVLTTTTSYRRYANDGTCSTTPTQSTGEWTVTVTPQPTITASSVSPTSACGSGTFTFSATPSTGATVVWYTAASGGNVVSDVTDINLSTTTIYYAEAQNGSCVSASRTAVTATVNALPTITLGTSPSVCAGSTSASLPYTGTTGTPTDYRIDFDATAEGQGFADVSYTTLPVSPITITVPAGAAAGTYNANLYVKNANTCESEAVAFTVEVKALPAASASNNGPICAGSTATITTTEVADASYSWTGPSSFTANTREASATVAGDYTVTVTKNGCSSQSTTTLVVNPLPTITSASVSPTSACGSGTFTFSATPSTGATVVWYDATTGGSVVSDVTDIVLSTTTTYYAEAQNGSCVSASRTAVTATVNALPTPSISGDNSVCAGETGVIYSTANVANHTYSWTVTGGTITSGAGTSSITVTWGTGTSGTVNVTETITATGCSASATQYAVTINPLPDADITASGALTFCQGGSVTLTADEPTAVGTTYQWKESGTSIGGENGRTLVVASSGNYTVTVEKNGCTATTATATTVTVNPLPVITTQATNQTRCGTGDVTFTAATTSPYSVIDWSGTTDFATYTTANSYTESITAGSTEYYYYRARNTETGCVSTYLTVTGTAYTLPSTTITGNSTVVVSTNLNLSSADAMSTYSWIATGSPTITNATSQTATFSWSTAGNYVVTLTYTNANGCSNTATHNVEVTGSPITPTKLKITTIATQTSGTAFGVTVQAVDDDGNLGNVTTATDFTLSVNTGSGVLSGTVSGTIANGASSATVSVTYTKAGGDIDVSLLATRTSGMVLSNGTSNTFNVFAAEPSQAAITSISRTTTTATVNMTAGGGDRRLVVIQQGGGTTIVAPTDGNRYTANPVYSLGDNLGSLTYVVLDSNVTSFTISGLQRNKTLYTVQVFELKWDGSNAATVNYNTSSVVKMSFRTLLKETENGESLISGENLQMSSVNPNPATENVNFTIYADEMTLTNIEIVNEVGMVVMAMQKDLAIGENHISLNINSEKGGLPSGTYFLRVTSGDETLTQKFIYMP